MPPISIARVHSNVCIATHSRFERQIARRNRLRARPMQPTYVQLYVPVERVPGDESVANRHWRDPCSGRVLFTSAVRRGELAFGRFFWRNTTRLDRIFLRALDVQIRK